MAGGSGPAFFFFPPFFHRFLFLIVCLVDFQAEGAQVASHPFGHVTPGWISMIRCLKRRLSSTPDGRHFVPMRDSKQWDLSLADPEDVRKEKERFIILTS